MVGGVLLHQDCVLISGNVAPPFARDGQVGAASGWIGQALAWGKLQLACVVWSDRTNMTMTVHGLPHWVSTQMRFGWC